MKAIFNRFKEFDRLFIVFVIIPTIISIIYFGFIASNVYVSESRFVVRSPEKPSASGLGVLLKGVGFSNAGDEIFVAQYFVESRDGLSAINNGNAFRIAYQRKGISIFDRFDPLGFSGSFEDLYRFYQGKVSIDYDSGTSITRLVVKAYTPEDARRFNAQLLELAEATVNRMNARGRKDLIGFAAAEVEHAKRDARQAALALSAFRNRNGVVDPEKQAAVQMQMISKLQDEIITNRTMLAELQHFTPRNPQIGALQTRIKALTSQMDDELRKVAGDNKSLAASAAQYQRLMLDSQFADKQLASAMASLQDAENEARRKQAYVERIVQPNLPDYPIEPRRWRGILSTFLLGLVAWGISSMLLAGLREHRD